jgi:hypothetical protein
VDEGLPTAYQVLEDHVVAAPEEDIFHGVVMRAVNGRRFIAADQIASLHEHGVDLRIDAAEAEGLPEPHGSAPAWRVHEPGAKPSRWKELVDRMTGARAHRRDWDEQD